MNNKFESSYDETDDQPPLGVTSRKIIQSFKAKADKKRTQSERIADLMTQKFGSIAFLAVNAIWFTAWILLNIGVVPGVKPFDPFPFGFLTMVVSLEAIFLAIIVLISQNRAAKIDDLREEIDLRVDIITEQEITKLLQLTVSEMVKKGFKLSEDKELNQMIQPTNMKKIESVLEKEII